MIDLPETQCRLDDVMCGASLCGEYYYAIYLANVEFGMGIVITDSDWVNGELRELLNEQISY